MVDFAVRHRRDIRDWVRTVQRELIPLEPECAASAGERGLTKEEQRELQEKARKPGSGVQTREGGRAWARSWPR